MKIIIAGAQGNVGRAVTEHCIALGDEVIACSSDYLDITNKGHVLSFVKRETCHVVINCAAWTDVDACELDHDRNYAVNAVGVENLALASRAVDASFVTISTDFVFNGEKEGFYTQNDAPNPINEYGRAKLEGERRGLDAFPRTIVVRSGWIFGRYGKNFLSKVGQIVAAGEPVKAISDSFGTPTYAPDLARRIRELAVLNVPGIYHAANAGEGVSYAQFAREAGGNPGQIVEVSGQSLQRPAQRPRNTRLKCLLSDRLALTPLRDWRQAVKDHLEKSKWFSDHISCIPRK